MSRAETARTVWQVCRTQILAWVALCVLLTLTFALAYVPMGTFNIVAALGIAALKVAIVAFAFMELGKSDALIRLTSTAAFVWLLTMFALTFADYLTR